MPSKKPSILDRLESLEARNENEDKEEDTGFESLKQRIQALERAVFGRTDEQLMASDDSVLEEDGDEEIHTIKGFIIIAPCPSSIKGVNHYYTDDEEGTPWSGNIGDAMVYLSKSKAGRLAKEIWDEEQDRVPFYTEYRKSRKKMPLLVKAWHT